MSKRKQSALSMKQRNSRYNNHTIKQEKIDCYSYYKKDPVSRRRGAKVYS